MIELQSLQKVLAQQTVVDIESLGVKPGEAVAIIGSVGSGMETLLELLMGRTRPTAGTVRLVGVDPAVDRNAFSRQVGLLFAEDTLYRRQSARANLRFYCQLHGLPLARADEVLAQVGLGDQMQTMVEKLSPGLARRLAWGRAILHRPAALILVEPFARCDETTITLLGQLARQWVGEGKAVLMLADDATHLTPICDRLYALNQGRLTEITSPAAAEEHRAAPLFKIPVRTEDKVLLVNPADILYAVAQEGRAVLCTTSGLLPTQFTLAELEQRLARGGFFRAHRGYLVNLQHVKEVIPYTRDSFSLRLDDAAGTVIPLSKTAAGELRDLLGY